MSEAFAILIVDDDPVTLEAISSTLEDDFPVHCFESAEACLARLSVSSDSGANDTLKPGMFLLDISLPGMDGYTFCRQLKDDPAFKLIPITFISGHDTIEARLTGYDAGGDDFIVKPFDPEEVRRKVRVAQQLTQNRLALQEQAESAEFLSSLALASMDEAGIVLQFMTMLISWNDENEIANGLLDLMKRYQLDGVVQIRIGQRCITVSAAGSNLPLETSVMNHVRGLERIFEFRNRSVHNFEHVTLMVNNMPLHDPEFCGRIRDNLSVAGQGTNSRLLAIETQEKNNRNQAGILAAMENIRESISTLRQGHQQDRLASSELILNLEQSLASSFVHLGLTDSQERFMVDMVADFAKNLVKVLDRGEDAHEALLQLSHQLGQLH